MNKCLSVPDRTITTNPSLDDGELGNYGRMADTQAAASRTVGNRCFLSFLFKKYIYVF